MFGPCGSCPKHTITVPTPKKLWSCILPGTLEQACALFTCKPWVERLGDCSTNEEVTELFERFLVTTWANRNKPGDGVFPFLIFTRREDQEVIRMERMEKHLAKIELERAEQRRNLNPEAAVKSLRHQKEKTIQMKGRMVKIISLRMSLQWSTLRAGIPQRGSTTG